MRDRRFFIDHGMIHDIETGRHVTTETKEWAFGAMDIEETCDLLNELWSQRHQQADEK